VMSEGDFRKAVAPQGDTRRKKHKVFVFVHGFNSNFQESLFRLAQLQADIKIDGIPILFSWPSQGQIAAYEMDKQSAGYSRDYLMALLTMLSSSSEVGDIMVVAHSMGAMLTVDALRQLRIEGKDRVIARLGRVVLAAPDINAKTFRAQVQAVGPLKPPLLVLVSKDDGALRVSSFLDGGIARAGDIDVDDPVVREAAMTNSSVLPYFIHNCTTKPRVIATRLAHSSLQMTMRRSCGRSTSEIRWLRNERLARIEPARRRNRLIPFHAGYNRSNPSFFQITNRFDHTHARPERNSGAPVRILMVVIGAITRWPSRCPLRGHSRQFCRVLSMSG